MRGLLIHAAAAAILVMSAPRGTAGKLPVAATTTIVGDFVRAIGGETVDVFVLLPCEADPHTFQPRPVDVARLTRGRVVFVNGLGLEEGLRAILDAPELRPRVVCVSDGIEARRLPDEKAHAHGGESGGKGHEHGAVDPHVWFDPVRVAQWTVNIERALSRADPAHAAGYAARAEQMRRRLGALDAWIRGQIARLPPDRRRLVTDHASFGYLADRYGLSEEGSLLPGFSTLAQPSAREMARLQEILRRHRIRVIFTGSAARSPLLDRVARDTGVTVVRLHTGALTAAGGAAPDYFSLMRYNVSLLVKSLL